MARLAAGSLAVTLVASLIAGPPAQAAPRPMTLSAQGTESISGLPVRARPRPGDLSQGAGTAVARPPVWPSAATEEAVIGGEHHDRRFAGVEGPAQPTLAQAGHLPVWAARPRSGAVDTPRRVRVSVLDRGEVPAGLRNGLVMRVARADGEVATGRARITVDYSAFRGAFGGDWASRLRLYALPECALTTPGAPGCDARPLDSGNDAGAQRISADVEVAGSGSAGSAAAAGGEAATGSGTLIALAAGASGAAGDYSATSLQASSSWSAGGNTGDFSWKYPIATVPPIAGPAPAVALAYSSTAVDGRSETTNNQPSWVGEGFEYWPGYVERRYTTCADDMSGTHNNTTETGDRCWATDNAVVSLNGRTTEMIRDSATGTWRLKNDDGSKIERLNNTVNGDNDNEYWKITTADGNQYFFGLNRLPGYTATAPADKTTRSTWTVPVAGNHAGEPCHQSGFVASFCSQAWRWNLDYVVDLNGNTMSLWYTPETNRYGRNLTATDDVIYTRGGTLDRIDYGTDNRSGTDTANTLVNPPMRVVFTAADRCLSSCSTHDAQHWPDVPWDRDCAGPTCTNQLAPTFWSTKRLASITTKVWDAGSAQYRDVTNWTFTHNFPPTGDGTRSPLWLESIVNTGYAGGSAVSLPEVNFDWLQMPNRVDTFNGTKPTMNWHRMSTIWTETGAKISIRYTGPDCVAGSRMPTSPQNNTLRCYPVKFEDENDVIKTEYFHKYLVEAVVEADLLTNAPDVETNYEYVGTPAWRHADDDGITQDNLRTWSDFRGYAQVKTRKGDPVGNERTLTVSTFFRGLHGDLDGSGGTRSVVLPAIDLNGDGDTADIDTADARQVNDEDAFAGMVRQTVTYNGVESDPVSATANEPWMSAPTASRDMGQTTVYARRQGMLSLWSSIKLAAGGWRVTRSNSTYDAYGMEIEKDDLGDVAVSGDERCTKTTYLRNTGKNLLSLASRVQAFALPCGQEPQGEADVIGDTRNSFDGQAYGVVPTRGLTSRIETAKNWPAVSASDWITTTTSTFDTYGRTVDTTDLRGNHTLLAFTPAVGPVTKVTTTLTNGWTSVAEMDPGTGNVTGKIDVNNRRTDLEYDGLGRLAKVWLPNHPRSAFPQQPSSRFTYLIRNSGGANAVTTEKLNAANGYSADIELFDGLLRSRQTQSLSKANGHVGTVFTETKYDKNGRAYQTNTHFDEAVQPSTTLRTVLDWQPKIQNVTVFDRADRVIASVMKSAGQEKWRTTTSYGGDRVSTVPPLGGIATTKIADAQGRTVELRQYKNPADVGSDDRAKYDLTSYHFNQKGQQDSTTDNAGNTWTYSYDLLGRQYASHDPDKGDSTAVFNDAGDLLSITDSRGRTLAYTYDSLGRKDAEYEGSTSGPKLASWTYDPPGAKGQLAASSRWIGGEEYRIRVRGYTPLYRSTGEDFVIPASQTGLAGTYTVTRSYKVDGSPATMTYPSVGGLGGETVTYTYDATTGLPEQLTTNYPGVGQYVTNTDYTAFGELSLTQYQTTAGNWLQRGYTYDDSTRRLLKSSTIRQVTPQPVAEVTYEYDPSGNIIKLADTPTGGTADTQCFTYDWVQRLKDAWTPADGDCVEAGRTTANLGGPAPYWLSWTYDAVGNRQTQTSHGATGNTTATYTYPAAGGNQPHALQSVTTVGPGVNKTDTYAYDSAGNTEVRPGVVAAQTLTWDAEGRLAKVNEDGEDTTYLYTADGARLIGADPDGTTLYLPSTEVRRDNATGAVTATRYYHWADQVIASRATSSDLIWYVSDNQGTQQIAVASGNQATTQRRQTPYGTLRGADPGWPTRKGFVGGDSDPTGMTHLGAREYDPATGRFISVDPVMDQGVPQSWAAYAYANHSPVTFSDPTGACTVCLDVVAFVWVNTVDTVMHPIGDVAETVDNVARTVGPAIEITTEVAGGPADFAWDRVQDASTALMGTEADPTGIRLGWEWTTGNGPDDRTLDADGRFARTLREHSHVQKTRDLIARQIEAGTAQLGNEREHHYQLGSPASEALNKLVSDFTSNQSAAFLGSYHLYYTVDSIDAEAGTATVTFRMWNESDMNSATHTSPVLGGYSDWWVENIEPEVNRRFEGEGPMHTKHQTLVWTEKINIRNPKPPRRPFSIPSILRRIFTGGLLTFWF